MAKKKKATDLIPVNPKTVLSNISKEYRIRFGNKHDHVMLITQKSVFLIN